MAKCACECLLRIREVTKQLEVELGPDSCDLTMCMGLHSFTITAGLLKGDRARFQLFGDTMNTTSRMESTGMKDRIQCSEVVAELLREHGEEPWLTPRDDEVHEKGKGMMTTFWWALGPAFHPNRSLTSIWIPKLHFRRLDGKEVRLVDWMVEILLEQLKKIVIVRHGCKKEPMESYGQDLSCHPLPVEGKTCLDEVQETITMPRFDGKVAEAKKEF